MANTALTNGQSMTRVCQPKEWVSFQGTLTGSSTLTPTFLGANGTNYGPASSDALGTVLTFTTTFGWVTLQAPSNGGTLKLAASGSGSWVVEGAL